jgi:hypothetical protein
MAADKPGNRPQEDAILARLRPAPGQAPVGVTSYIGLLGKSPKEGYWLLYLTLDMSQWVEINEADIVYSEQLPPDRSPFGSLGGTQVFVKQNATLITSKTVSQTHPANEPPDEFDLDVRLGGGASAIPLAATVGVTCQGCVQTQCNQATCANTCPNTCANTCPNTCPNTCNTCNTCRTQCNQPTCADTCRSCNCTDTCHRPCM